MKPITLKMTAFGSYCGTAEVDFTKLYDNGIFLITGKTGGGKTTILDAMCVALYGKATGSERAKEWRQLRCNNAPSSVDTELEYIFSIGGTQYKLYRRWHLPNSKKGEPQLKEAESACYLRPDGEDEWELIASGSAKVVGEAAEEILKLTQTQFVKVIMLPQGEFRELLTASSDEKEAIFQKLFDTGRWERLTARISEEYRAVEKQCSEHTSRKEIALKSAECANADELQAKTAQTKGALTELQTQAEANTLQAAQTAAALKAAEDTAALFAELNIQRAALDKLTAQSDKFGAIESKLRQSRQLRGVLPQFNLQKAAKAQELKCVQTLTAAEQSAQCAAAALEKAKQDCQQLPALEEKRRQLLSAASSLNELAESRAPYAAAVQKLQSVETALKAEEARLAQLLQTKTDAEGRIAKGSEYVEQCHAASRALAEATEFFHQTEQLFHVASEWEEKNAQLTLLTQKREQSEKNISHLEQELASRQAIARAVEQAILNDTAYSLAVNLAEGAPCPVCGSVHHPTPAQPSDSTPTAAELEQCRQRADQCAQKLETARATHFSLNTEYDVLRQSAEQLQQKAGGGFEKTSSQLKTELDAAEQRVKQLRALSAKTESAQKRLSELNDQLAANVRDIESANTNINNCNIQITAAKQTIDSLTERLQARGIGNFEELDKALSQVKRDMAAIDRQINALNDAHAAASSNDSRTHATLTAAQGNLEAARLDLAARQTEFRARCAELGIAEDTDIEGGVLGEKIEAEYERELSAYRQQLAFAQRRISELSASLNGKEPPLLDELRAANAAAIEAGQEIARQSGQLTSRLQFLEDTAAAVSREQAALAGLEQRYDTARRMNQLLSGQNEARTPIHQYVIGIKMDEVIMSANLYMTRLTKGQYAMKRKESTGGRAKHQGLDIEIIDSSAGRVRSVSTLSGGELFLASLSLAFGLSDVVQSFAGGIHLDSLFIDEGFGSLDSETLDTAMDAITQVRENKLLGIISHVSELKERIPCGIEVIKTNDGSVLKIR